MANPPPYYFDDKTTVVGRLIPAPTIAAGLGPAVYLATEAASTISGGVTSVSGVDDVATLLAGTQITAQAAADLNAMFGQSRVPATIWIATYDDATEDPSDAMDVFVASGNVDRGVITTEARADADLDALGTWHGTGNRRFSWALVVQSGNSDLITSGQPAAIDGLQNLGTRVLYHNTAAQPLGPAVAGHLSAYPLINGPVAGEIQVLGVNLPSLTSAELTFLKANYGATLLPLDAGASASQRIVRGVSGYDGSSWTASVSLLYTIGRCSDAIKDLYERRAIQSDPLKANAAGVAQVEGVLGAVLDSLFEVGHFDAGASGTPPNQVFLPKGYNISTTISGDDLLVYITVRIGQEVDTITLDTTGEVV